MAHPDMEALLDESLNAAVHFLKKNGEFFPFAVTMDLHGEIHHAQAFPGDEQPQSQEVIDLLVKGLTQGAAKGDYRATALICDVRVNTPSGPVQDAVSLTIEHHTDAPVVCYLPYVKSDGEFEFGSLFYARPQRQVFPSHTTQ